MHLLMHPVDPDGSIDMPPSWQRLDEAGFHPDLVRRTRGFLHCATRHGNLEVGREIAERFGKGFEHSFSADVLRPRSTDPFSKMKNEILDALEECATFFGDRVSSIVWESYATLALREDPTRYMSILTEINRLPHPYWLVDGVLHAVPIVYRMKDHLSSTIFQHAGVVIDHGCDCGCGFAPADDEETGSVNVFMNPRRIELSTAALWSHLLTQTYAIVTLKLPFEIGVSPNAAEIFAYEGAHDKVLV